MLARLITTSLSSRRPFLCMRASPRNSDGRLCIGDGALGGGHLGICGHPCYWQGEQTYIQHTHTQTVGLH